MMLRTFRGTARGLGARRRDEGNPDATCRGTAAHASAVCGAGARHSARHGARQRLPRTACTHLFAEVHGSLRVYHQRVYLTGKLTPVPRAVQARRREGGVSLVTIGPWRDHCPNGRRRKTGRKKAVAAIASPTPTSSPSNRHLFRPSLALSPYHDDAAGSAHRGIFGRRIHCPGIDLNAGNGMNSDQLINQAGGPARCGSQSTTI